MTQNRPSIYSCLRIASSLFLAVCAVGCVPIQLARFTQVEAYDITLNPDFGFEAAENSRQADLQEIQDRVDRVFMGLIGRSNWMALQNRYGIQELLEDPQRIKIHGRTTFVVYPVSSHEFLLEGTGRFFVIQDIRKKYGERRVLLSGDSFVGPTHFDLKDLAPGSTKDLDLKLKYFVTRIPGHQNYYADGEAFTTINIQLERIEGRSRAFCIKYDADHEVFVHPWSGVKEKLGTLRFHSGGMEKRVDLSGARFIRGIDS